MEELKKEIMRVRVITDYDDKELDTRVKENTPLTTTVKRGKELIEAKVAVLVSIEKVLDEEKVEAKIKELEAENKELVEKLSAIQAKNTSKPDSKPTTKETVKEETNEDGKKTEDTTQGDEAK